ncbi:hypothetical protein GCM10009647_090330 [Streptomyces sanglieri]
MLKQLGDGQHRRIPSLGEGFAQEDSQSPRLGDVGHERKGINVGRLCGWVGAVPELHGCGRDDCHGMILAEVEPLPVDPVVAEPLVEGKLKISPATGLPHDVQAHWRSTLEIAQARRHVRRRTDLYRPRLHRTHEVHPRTSTGFHAASRPQSVPEPVTLGPPTDTIPSRPARKLRRNRITKRHTPSRQMTDNHGRTPGRPGTVRGHTQPGLYASL